MINTNLPADLGTKENIFIIGTSHISAQSIREIQNFIKNELPDIVAVELDSQRLPSLFEENGKKRINFSLITKIGVKGFLFAKIGQIVQQKLGSVVGVAPGSEMKTAIELARKNNLQIALIDQPINQTLRNFSRQLTYRERFRFFGDLFLGVFFQKRQIKKLGLENFDLTKVPTAELIEKMMGSLKERYPSVYKTLVDDRNKYMVKQLISLVKKNPGKKILAVVGAGHKKEMDQLLLKFDIV